MHPVGAQTSTVQTPRTGGYMWCLARGRPAPGRRHRSCRCLSRYRRDQFLFLFPPFHSEERISNRWDRGLSGGTPSPTTIIICTTWCAYRYISRVRLVQVLILCVPGNVLQRVLSRQKLPTLYQVFPSVFGEDIHDPIYCSRGRS